MAQAEIDPSLPFQNYRSVASEPTVVLAVEFFALFIGIPILFATHVLPKQPIPILLIGALLTYLWLRRDKTFSAEFFTLRGFRSALLPLLSQCLAIGIILGSAVLIWKPSLLFSFARQSPLVWLLVMALYPIVSVYPQELIYRAFFFHRYRPLFRSERVMIVVSAAAFALVHILFGSWVSVFLSFLGGVIFARTYARSRSLLLTAIEHGILGDIIFTVGLGQFFYHGSS